MKETLNKKSMGRQKIEIKPIQKKSSLQVTFTKRRGGLFKKASELSVLCGAQIAILVQSPAKKIFAFGNPDVNSVLHRFETGLSSRPGAELGTSSQCSMSEYADAVMKLEAEKTAKEKSEGKFWWDEPLERMELYELEEYVDALEGLRSRVMKRAEEIQSSELIGDLLGDLGQDEEEMLYNYADLETLLNEEDFDNGGESLMFEGVSGNDISACASSSSSNFMENPTGHQYDFLNNFFLEDIMCNISEFEG